MNREINAILAIALVPGDQLALFVVLTEDKLTSSVSAGERKACIEKHTARFVGGPYPNDRADPGSVVAD